MTDALVLIGDFNVPQFANINAEGVYNAKADNLFNFAALCNFKQYNGILNTYGRLLDLIFSSIYCDVDLNYITSLVHRDYIVVPLL